MPSRNDAGYGSSFTMVALIPESSWRLAGVTQCMPGSTTKYVAQTVTIEIAMTPAAAATPMPSVLMVFARPSPWARAACGPGPRPPEQPERGQQETGGGHVDVRQGAVGDDVGRERVERERGQTAERAGQITGEGENDQTEQQSQQDHRQTGGEEHLLPVIAVFVENSVAEGPLTDRVGLVQVHVDERESGRHDDLGERRVLVVVGVAVVLEIGDRGAEVDTLVDRRAC